MANDTVLSFRVPTQTKDNIDKLAEMLSEQMGMPVSKSGAIGFAVKHMLDNGITICSASQAPIVNTVSQPTNNSNRQAKQNPPEKVQEKPEETEKPIPPLPEPFNLDQEIKPEIGLHARQNMAEIFMQKNLRDEGIKGKAIPFEMLYDIYKAWINKAKPGESQYGEKPLTPVAFCKTVMNAIYNRTITIDNNWAVADYLLEPDDIPQDNEHIRRYNLRRWMQPVPRPMYTGLVYKSDDE